MAQNTDTSTKHYKVVLECVDPKQETPASFAIKLSMRARTPMPRVQQVLRNLPYTLKSGLSIKQATRWKSVLEEIGGVARIEEHYVSSRPVEYPSDKLRNEPGADRKARSGPELLPGVEGELPTKTQVCPSCGWGESPGAEICSFCLQPFVDRKKGADQLEDRIPDRNPLAGTADDIESPAAGPGPIDLPELWRRHKTSIVIGAFILLVILLILK